MPQAQLTFLDFEGWQDSQSSRKWGFGMIWVDLGPSNDVQQIGKDETSVCQTRSIGSHVQKDHTSSGQGLCPRHFRSSQVSLRCSLLRRSLEPRKPAVSTGACGCGMHQFFWSILTHTTSIVSTNIHNTSPTKITIGLLARLFPGVPSRTAFFVLSV